MRIFKRDGSAKWWADWTDQKGQRRRKSTGTDDKKLWRQSGNKKAS